MLWPDPITIATDLIISAVTNDMKILPFQNCKIRNVFSYYGIIPDDLVLCFPNFNDLIKESSQRNYGFDAILLRAFPTL